ncbi:fasciclin-like arabinogalactan protein 2 [Typha latifolia]|uniref:fasciclin-like arabinogalactan protein 2 n=1 Tax=Typha latifolia TaxID=4733 RepID=UPI003C2FD4EB
MEMNAMRRRCVFFLFLVVACCAPGVCRGYNITKILAQHPDFSSFNHYLTVTRLASEINRRDTITVLAVDNAGMASLLAKHLTLPTIRHVLSLHVLVDYFGAKKLHQLSHGSTTTSSMFQATGAAPGTTGYVNITDHKAGHVTFAAADDSPDAGASFVKAIKEIPYNLSVIQISKVLSSPEAEAPVPPPAPVNLTELMYKKNCKAFADLLRATAGVQKTFDDSVDGGLTLFCPIDSAVKAFAPTFKNLTAEHKTLILLYHGVPVYYSIQMLKSNNGVVNTLATDGGAAKNYNYTVQNDGEVVTLETRVITATVKATINDADPLGLYSIDRFLRPSEMFKIAEAPAEAPAAGKKKKAKKGAETPEAAEGPDEAPADDATADSSDAAGKTAGLWMAAAAAAVVAAVAGVV